MRKLVEPLIGPRKSNALQLANQLPDGGPDGTGLHRRFLQMRPHRQVRRQRRQGLLEYKSGEATSGLSYPGGIGAAEINPVQDH